MGIVELFILAVGLSMDAFAVSICKGLSLKKITFKKCCIVGLYFGIFQATMPLIGYFLGVRFREYITELDHWIAFVLLGIIGVNMIRESRRTSCEVSDDSLNFKSMLVLAVATSIDALAVGITFAFLNVQIIPAVSFIGVVTFICSFIGVKIGNLFGCKFKSKAELAGGVILICMGAKILLEHLRVF